MVSDKTIKAEKVKRESNSGANMSDETIDLAQNHADLPTGSGDTIPNTDVEMSQDAPVGHNIIIDEGYQTSFVGKEPTPNSSSTIRSSIQPSTGSVAATHTHHTPNTATGMSWQDLFGESGKGLDVLGRGVKKLVKGMNFLRQLGVENLVEPLPKIAVVGGQSTGKSSLIEAISEIKVPRDTGTTTRCPIEINLSEASDGQSKWTCKVVLHKKYTYEPGVDRSRNHTLYPWIEWDPEDITFATLDSKDDVEHTLKWAQLATLNPRSNPELFIAACKANTAKSFPLQVKFSPNVVRLDITGPNLPNLSFYDLPGVINVADTKEEEHLVELVVNLVKGYIAADKCINLLALPMTDDVANSKAYGIIKEVGAEHRTIGVLTKPDRTHPGDKFTEWQRILDGEMFRLGYGYFVTKQCGQDDVDRGIDHAEARAQENDFFSLQQPWAGKLSYLSKRFGTHNLQRFLSQRLTEQIRDSLPQINTQVSEKAMMIDLALADLPDSLADDPQVIVNNKLMAFDYRLQQYLTWGSSLNQFQTSWDLLAEQFRSSIMNSYPRLTVRHYSETPKKHIVSVGSERRSARTPGTPTPSHGQPIEVIDSDEDIQPRADFVSPSSRKRLPKFTRPFQESSKKRRGIEKVPEVDPFVKLEDLSKRLTLDQVRQAIRDAHSSGIPLHIDPKAADGLSMASLQHWNQPLFELFKETEQKLEDLVNKCLSDVFGAYKKTELFTELSTICNGFLTELMEKQRSMGQRCYNIEVFRPYALNESTLEGYRAAALADIGEARRNKRINIFIDEQEQRLGRLTTGPEREVKVQKVTDAQIGPDPFAKEVDVMSVVRGYYTYAGSRFVDNVCQSIRAELFVECCNRIYGVLRERLGIAGLGANVRCAQLLAEDPQTEIKRAQLKKERATLAKAQEWFARLARDESDTESDQDLFLS